MWRKCHSLNCLIVSAIYQRCTSYSVTCVSYQLALNSYRNRNKLVLFYHQFIYFSEYPISTKIRTLKNWEFRKLDRVRTSNFQGTNYKKNCWNFAIFFFIGFLTRPVLKIRNFGNFRDFSWPELSWKLGIQKFFGEVSFLILGEIGYIYIYWPNSGMAKIFLCHICVTCHRNDTLSRIPQNPYYGSLVGAYFWLLSKFSSFWAYFKQF